jgi:predicted anti-sigma-YlaC factor YlaD
MDLYLEGELDAAERREIEEHLAACVSCRRVLEERRVIDLVVAGIPPIAVPPEFARTVLARLPHEPRPGFGWLASVATAITLLLAGLLGYHLLTGESLVGVFVSLGRSVVGFFGLVVPLLAKVLELGRVFIGLARDFGAALLRGLQTVSSLLKPEILGLVLALAFILLLLVIFGVRKIVALGEKS